MSHPFTQPAAPSDSALAERPARAAQRSRPPPLYQVVMLNDDYTPMGFVVAVLRRFFQMDEERATVVMMQIHHLGRAVCGVFSEDVAQTKITLVTTCAREEGHPLLCTMEAM